jgi:hypothetical protein
MGKTLKDLQDNGKQITTLDIDDLFLVAQTPFATTDDGVIEWGDIQSLIANFLSYQIVPSVSSNNLTVAIKARDGNDASATNPIKFVVGNSIYTVSGAVSYTKNAGTNWAGAGGTMFAAKDIDYFVYAIAETGASAGLKFGHSRIPSALTMADLSSTSTNEKYLAGNWVNFNATDSVRNIGRFRAQLSATASFNWSIPTAKVINYPKYETDWLTYLPTYSATAPMTFGTVTTAMAIYQVKHTEMEVKADFNGTTGGTATNTIEFTLPFSANVVSGALAYGTAYVLDVAASAGYWRVGTPLSLDKIYVLKADETVFGLAAGKYTRGSIILPI